MKTIDRYLMAIFLCFGLAQIWALDGHAANIPVTSVEAAQGSPLRLTPNMSLVSLSGRPDSTLMLLPSGRTMELGKLRRLSRLTLQAKQAKTKPRPRALTLQPAATGRRVVSAQDLSEALKRPDTDTLQLPSGQRITVAMLRYLQPLVEQQLGHSLTQAASRPERSGTAIKITNATDKAAWEKILRQPDSTILENPSGKRITLGELKQGMETQLKEPRRQAVPTTPKKR